MSPPATAAAKEDDTSEKPRIDSLSCTSTLPKEPVETPEPLTSVTVPSLNSVMSVAILDETEVNEPDISLEI